MSSSQMYLAHSYNHGTKMGLSFVKNLSETDKKRVKMQKVELKNAQWQFQCVNKLTLTDTSALLYTEKLRAWEQIHILHRILRFLSVIRRTHALGRRLYNQSNVTHRVRPTMTRRKSTKWYKVQHNHYVTNAASSVQLYRAVYNTTVIIM